MSGREKKPYAIWRKMENKQISLEQLSDIYGFRVIVDTIDDCYRVLGVAHTTWRTVPGRFKDYISTPKQNNYQSIHTTVVGPRHQRVELQIRTRDMHAHRRVRRRRARALQGQQGASTARAPAPRRRNRCRRTAAPTCGCAGSSIRCSRARTRRSSSSTPSSSCSRTRCSASRPKGRLIALPRDATPLDFAYAVHTDIGNAAVGAFVNGRHVPIDTPLRNGDEVEIETAKGHSPPAAWENLVVTGRARSAIRRAARDAVRKQYRELGRRLLASRFEQLGEELNDDVLKKALPRLGRKSLEDVLAAIGRNELSHRGRGARSHPRCRQAQKREGLLPPHASFRARPRPGGLVQHRSRDEPQVPGRPGADSGTGLAIRGVKDDLPVTFEPGGAVPGDRIVGVLIPAEGIRIFQIHSPRLKEFEHEGWIDVTWDIDPDTPAAVSGPNQRDRRSMSRERWPRSPR